MALLYSATATASVAANTNSITVAGMDLNAVLQGMVINLGARDRLTGDGYIIASVAPNGTSGGTLTTVGTIPAAFNNAAFVVDTRDFNGTAPNYLIAMYTLVLTTLLRLTSPLTNLFSGSRVLALDKDTAGAVSRLLYAIGGRTWFGAEQRTLTYTPTGGAQTAVETLSLRAYADGTLPSDALMIDLTTGGVDALAASSAMVAAATVDLASAPTAKVAISGAAQIASFGVGKHKVREVHFVDGGSVLVHSALSLILPSGVNITTRAGDTLRATSDASGNWRVRSYDRADGTPLISLTAFRNLLINARFLNNTRGYAFTSLAAGIYGLDRWKGGSNGVSLTNGGGLPDASIVISSGSLVQVVEDRNVDGGSYVLSWSGTAQARVGINGSAPSAAYAASPIRVTGATAGQAITVEFTGGSILQPQLEAGGVVTPFERRPRQIEDTFCQRYYQALGNWIGAMQETDGTKAFLYGKYPTMRGAPTPILANPSNYLSRPNVASFTPSSIAFSGLTVEGGYIGFNVPTQAAGVFIGTNQANGVMLSAEL